MRIFLVLVRHGEPDRVSCREAGLKPCATGKRHPAQPGSWKSDVGR